MDTPVIWDTVDIDEASASAPTTPITPAPPAAPAAEAVPERALRRFSFDPASSPVLMAALAWDTASTRY